MATITATTFRTLMGLESTFNAGTAEEIIDQAVDLLNLYGDCDVPNMSGTALSKTLSVDSREKGAIMLVARAIYYGFYLEPGTHSLHNATLSTADVMGNPAVIGAVKEAARQLSELDVDYG